VTQQPVCQRAGTSSEQVARSVSSGGGVQAAAVATEQQFTDSPASCSGSSRCQRTGPRPILLRRTIYGPLPRLAAWRGLRWGELVGRKCGPFFCRGAAMAGAVGFHFRPAQNTSPLRSPRSSSHVRGTDSRGRAPVRGAVRGRVVPAVVSVSHRDVTDGPWLWECQVVSVLAPRPLGRRGDA